ncbi:MAG: fumarylacetoacetate hydrolase family protein [Actinomycetota bacterium]|nr:fumarylacetoacetate hydrolase family protein [Actinomycetota bacterium]MEC9058831.1 fumarylacetoacetate hydrolase family protein [Actinomycetota bacterium]
MQVPEMSRICEAKLLKEIVRDYGPYMLIARHLLQNRARIASVVNEELINLETDHADLPGLLAAGTDFGALPTGEHTPLAEAKLLAPVGAPPAILAVGLNYRAHAEEGGREVPTTPVIFTKHHNCVIGPGAGIHIPTIAPEKVDYEGELAIVIGKRCRHVPRDHASEVIAGYTIMNDVSVRDWQRASPTMLMGKSWDTHGPMGPWVVTGDEVDPHRLQLTTRVNGEIRQDSNTDDLIFDCFDIVHHLSSAFTLDPGTVIATGTPAGVGLYWDPPKMLGVGDEVSITIEGIGTLTNPVIEEPDTQLV